MPKKKSGIDEVAIHYGFEPTDIPPRPISGIPSFRPEEKISILKSYLSNNPSPEEENVSLIYNNKAILVNNRLTPKKRNHLRNFSLDIVGVPNSIAEAIVIQTAVIALNEEGFKDISIEINSIGEKDSFALYKDKLYNYYKERVEELHPKCRNFTKKNIFHLLNCPHEECQTLKKDAPKTLYFLSENSQKHLKEVLEHLESTQITYQINDSLVFDDDYFSKIIFEIKSKKEDKAKEILLGRGGRYDDLVEKITKSKNSFGVGISLEIEKKSQRKQNNVAKPQPKFCFIQLGPKAKLKSLSLLELLRQANLPIQQNLYMNKLSDQIQIAQKAKIPYAIIMGQKEATEDTVIVKDFRKATQTTISTANLFTYLKQLK